MPFSVTVKVNSAVAVFPLSYSTVTVPLYIPAESPSLGCIAYVSILSLLPTVVPLPLISNASVLSTSTLVISASAAPVLLIVIALASGRS